MKKVKNICLLFVTLLSLVLLAAPKADAATYGNLTYTVSGGKATITDCKTSASGVLAIPDTLGGYPVVTINSGAFSGCKDLNAVTIPDTVIMIQSSAFQSCSGLTAVAIGEGVTTIGNYAFSGCSSLTTITIPDGVISIGNSAFSGCSNLTSVTIPGNVTSIGDKAFGSCCSLRRITIPDSVTTIGNNAFEDCTRLTTVNITNPAAWCMILFGDGYKSNPLYYADTLNILDENGNSVTEVVLDETVTRIPPYAFSATNITSVTIPNSVTTIGDSAFYDCTGLITVIIPNSVATIGKHAFDGCYKLTSISIPNGLTTIEKAVFQGCSGLTSIIIPDCVTTIGDYAFNRCSGLTSVNVPDNVNSVGERAFSSCSNMTDITIGNGVTYIGDYALSVCDSLNGIWVDLDNSEYSSDCFGVLFNKEKTELVLAPRQLMGAYTIPESVNTINDGAFTSCTGLTSVTIPDSVSAICKSAFVYCDKLVSVAIGNGVTDILDYAFCECVSLTNINIPEGVTSIGVQAFKGCVSLMGISIPDTVRLIGDKAFQNCSNLINVTIGDSVREIGGYAFYECASLVDVNIPESVTFIGNYAFYGCLNLDAVYYGGTKSHWLQIAMGSNNSCLTNAQKYYNHIHNYTLFPAETVAPTCVTYGYTIYTCVYGECVKADIVPAVGHVKGEYVECIPPTCSEEGYSAYQCDRCKIIFKLDIVDKLGHDYTRFKISVAPTCLEGGYTIYQCIRCNGEIKTDAKLALGHDYTGEEKAIEKCLEEGYKGPTCTRCYDVRKDTVLEAVGHKVVYIPTCDPTCEEAGVAKAGTQCERCKSYFVEPVFSPALGHKYSEYVSNNDATYFEDGTKTAVCATCGDVDTVTDEGSRLIPEGNVILRQPVSANAASGETVTFAVEVFGEIVSYRWQYRKLHKWFSTSLAGHDTDTLTVPATGSRNGYEYRCVVTFADGTVLYSNAAKLTVDTTITITKNPGDQTVVLGAKGQFSANAQGEGLKFQWQYKRPDSEKWINTTMEGATKPTVYIESATSRDGYQYRCHITDAAGKEVFTEAATMRVLFFNDHPETVFTRPGINVTFSVAANVDSGFTYQWQYRRNTSSAWTNTSLEGYNTAILTVGATLARNGYEYRCVITGAKNGKLESKAANLHVGNPVEILQQPQGMTVINTDNAVLTVEATSVYAYQWYYSRNGANWYVTTAEGNQTATLTVPAKGKNGYQYRCLLSGLDGTQVYTESATLTVVEPPLLEIIAKPTDRTVPAERTVRFAVVVDGDVTTYQWQYSADGETWQDAAFEGADTNLLTVVATQEYNGCQFRCVITGLYGVQIITESATLRIETN